MSNVESQWMVISGLPDFVSGADIKNFLNGLKVSEIYGYYYHNSSSSSAAASGTLDAYVAFETKSGVSAALLRDGENLFIDCHKDNKIASNPSACSRISREKTAFAAHLHRVTSFEASWAKALSVRLENSSPACSANLVSVRSAFLPSLLCSSPAESIKRWLSVVPLDELPLPEEICSYAMHQKKFTGRNKSYRYDYKDSGGLRLDIHQMSGGVSFSGLLGFSCDGAATEDFVAPLLNSGNAIHGAAELNELSVEVSHILDDLGSTMCGALLSRSDTTTERSSHSDCVLDIAHRMSCMYQFIQGKLHAARYMYKASYDT